MRRRYASLSTSRPARLHGEILDSDAVMAFNLFRRGLPIEDKRDRNRGGAAHRVHEETLAVVRDDELWTLPGSFRDVNGEKRHGIARTAGPFGGGRANRSHHEPAVGGVVVQLPSVASPPRVASAGH